MDTTKSESIAIVTGASSGIGRATAVRLAKDNIKTVITARDETALQVSAQSVEKAGGKALCIPADLTDGDAIKRIVEETVSHFGRLDILVNAAGIIGSGTIENTTLEAYDSMMNINLRAVFVMMQAAVPYLIKTRGVIVNVSSVTGIRAFPGVLTYCISKAGVDQLTRCAALELAPKGVRVNAIDPGVIRSNLHRRGGMDEEAYTAFVEHSKTTHPLGRIGEPEEAAELIAFLATDRSSWITGATIPIDGGRSQTCAR